MKRLGAALVSVIALGALLLHAHLRRSPTAKCPFGYDESATPAQRSAARRMFASTHRGTTLARSRVALQWTLDVTTRAEVLAWARANGVGCVARGSDLECSHVESLSALWLGFDDGARLVAVTAFHDGKPLEATSAYHTLVKGQTARAGSPSVVLDGDVTRGALVQASTEWRVTDAWARVNVTNMGHDRCVVIEEYRSLR